MAFLEDRAKSWPVGIGLVVLAVSAGPKLMKVGRPFVKRVIKGYLAAQEKTKEVVAEGSERMQDIYAEAKHEFEQEQITAHAESDMMPEPMMAEATSEPVQVTAEGAKRSSRAAKQADATSVDG